MLKAICASVLAALCVGFLAATPLAAQVPSAKPVTHLRVIYLGKHYREPTPLSFLDQVVGDKGIAGARVGAADNNITGSFIGQITTLWKISFPENADIAAEAKKVLSAGSMLIVADLEARICWLSPISPRPKARSYSTHVQATMRFGKKTAALTSFISRQATQCVPTRWASFCSTSDGRVGSSFTALNPAISIMSRPVKRAAARFGARIVAERPYTFDARTRDTDTGHQQTEQQIALLTQSVPDYDVIFVVDNDEAFGDYLLYNSTDPHPVVGTQGLVAVAWHPAVYRIFRQGNATRFLRLAHRAMTEPTSTKAWLGVRIFGEAM